MDVSILPSTNIIAAAFTAWRNGRHIKQVDGRVVMAPGRDRAQLLKAFKANSLLAFASDLNN